MLDPNLQLPTEEVNLSEWNDVIKKLITDKFDFLMPICTQKTHGTSVDPADVIQEFVLSLLEKKDPKILKKLKDAGISYVISSLKNKCIDLIRKNKIRSAYHLKSAHHSPSFAQPNMALEKEESAKSTNQRLNQLKPDQAKVIQLALKGYKNTEIATLLELHPKNVSTLKRRGLKKLQASML